MMVRNKRGCCCLPKGIVFDYFGWKGGLRWFFLVPDVKTTDMANGVGIEWKIILALWTRVGVLYHHVDCFADIAFLKVYISY